MSNQPALMNLCADLASAQALRLALEANADRLPDPVERLAARARAERVYLHNAAHANRIYRRAAEARDRRSV